MDLIYTDADRVDIGVLQNFTMDMAFGKDENSFELTTTTDQNILVPNSIIYIENTEYGGIVDSVKVETASDTLKYIGRTWHGILQKKIIVPNEGQDHYTVTGEANTIIGKLIDYFGLESLFTASTNDSGININSYNFTRFCNGYDGLQKMLNTYNAKLVFKYSQGFCTVSAEPIIESDVDSSQVSFNIENTTIQPIT